MIDGCRLLVGYLVQGASQNGVILALIAVGTFLLFWISNFIIVARKHNIAPAQHRRLIALGAARRGLDLAVLSVWTLVTFLVALDASRHTQPVGLVLSAGVLLAVICGVALGVILLMVLFDEGKPTLGVVLPDVVGCCMLFSALCLGSAVL